MRRIAVAVAALALAGALVASVGAGTRSAARHNAAKAAADLAAGTAACKPGSAPAVVGGKRVCLKAGQKCKARYEPAYKRKGFHCAAGRLKKVSKPKPSISIADVSAAEGNSGTTTFSFPVTLSSAATQTVSVAYATADGTATAPSDYASATGTLTLKPGEKSKNIDVAVVGETAYEQDETFTVTLSTPVNATIATGSATGTIKNDDTIAQAGHYSGKLSTNEIFEFDVTADGANVTGLRTGQINESCNPDLITLAGGNLDFGSRTFPISPDGTFNVNVVLSGTVGGAPLTAVVTISGRFSGAAASGTFLEVDNFTYAGTNFTCTSNPQTWNATHV